MHSLDKRWKDEKQRTRVGSYKSFFDTIGYVVIYALIPIFIGKGINIRTLCLICSPLLLTALIPVFMIKEGEKYGQGKDYLPEAKVSFRDSLRITLNNRLFMRWAIPNACAYFGLNMFLAAQNALISGLVYEQLKNIVTPKVIDGIAITGEEWKVGASLIPLIVSLACVFGMIIARKLPKSFRKQSWQKR